MSITFSYLDGAQSVDAFLAGRGNPAYAYLLYSRLGDLYVEKQRYQDAAGAYRAFVEPRSRKTSMRRIWPCRPSRPIPRVASPSW